MNNFKIKKNISLKKFTTLKIGGNAEFLYEAHSSNDLISIVKYAQSNNLPITVLGSGSNVLISDNGIKGIVVINKSTNKNILNQKSSADNFKSSVKFRWQADSKKGTFKYDFKDLDYDESKNERIKVQFDSGVLLSDATMFAFKNGITGLQWYSGIPGTIGGAIFNNIHGGTHFFSEIIDEITVIDPNLELKKIKKENLDLDYNKSRFQKSKEIIISAVLNLFKGDVQKAKAVYKEWGNRKKIQPRNSAGCVFANISNEQMKKLKYPTTSAGYIIEHILKMTSFRIGDAQVSKAHHNFIVNLGNATSSDYLAVIKEIIKRTKEKIGIKLVPEIVFLGFSKNELKEVI